MTVAWSPKTLAEAHQALRQGAVKAAGCTDLLVADHAMGRTHAAVLNVLDIAELQGIEAAKDELNIGAACTFTQIRRSREIATRARLLADAAATIGAAQIQNRATIGGNIANASPAGDSLPALLALGALIVVAGPHGRRTIPYNAFNTGYRKTALDSSELIERVVVPLPTPPVQIFRKIGTRQAQAISKVVVGFACDAPSGGILTNVRLAMGSVAPTPIRLHEVEAMIEGQALSRDLAERARGLVEQTITPIDDVRSTAAYRRHVAGAVVRRLLIDLLESQSNP